MKMLGGAPFVLLVEGQNQRTGLGIRFGAWLLERGYSPRYAMMGVTKLGNGGTTEQIPHQGLGPENILDKIREMAK